MRSALPADPCLPLLCTAITATRSDPRDAQRSPDPRLSQALCVLARASKARKPVSRMRDLEPREGVPWGG